ncbi:hypothetical protein TRVL_03617 [Trypanosoma vivax]|nr:hypothetical protein TRVL_03617 [Trypanosoma vivax]
MHGPPSQTLCVLGGNVRECEYCPLGSVMQKSYQRSLKAPLAATLNDWLSELHRLGNIVNVLRDVTGRAEEGEWMLFVELLPWIMSTKERNDTISAAMNCGKTWKSFLAEDIWDKESVRDSGAIVDGIYSSESSWGKTATWKNMEPVPGDAFRAVTLPNAARSLCDYGRSEAQGWRAVFGEKQNDLLNFLQHRIMEEAQIIYLFFLDLVHAVAATSEVSRVTVLTATRVTVLEELPLLHVWQPHYLMVDDYDQVEDWAYLTLSPTSVAVLSHQAEPPLRQEQQLAVTVLKALQKELHGTKFSTAAVLTSSLRFKRAELNKAVFLCRNNSPLTVYAPSRCPMQVTGTSTANTNGSYNVATSAVSGEAVANSDGEENSDHRGQPGFSSPSCVELWTHAVTSSVSPSCDGLAAAFVSDRITSVESSLRFSVYCGSALEREAIKEGISLHYANKKDRTGDAIALLESVFVLSAIPDAFVEHDEECDIAILCLSGISGLHRSVGDVERRQQLEQLADDQLFVERVEWWLWRAASRARSGFLLVGSRELFHFLQPLQRLERFVLQERERHGYWLPAEVSGAVLALRCPSHASCRQLAMITYADYCGCKVRLIGIQECRSLCLSPYDDCTNPAHACLHACHVPSGLSHICECGPECVANSLHRQCPFPCARTQPCGHVCLRRCSEPCVPCEFIGLQQLTCGQRVVTGVSDSGPTLALMRHFQQVPCGGTPRPCEEIVKVRCPRCGEKISMPCCQLTRRGGFDGIALSEAECAGCVALYNRVAVEFGGREMAVVVSTSDEEGGGASLLPVEELPEAAQEKLRKLRTVAMKKAQLMLQKEALETMQGKQTSEFYQQQLLFDKSLKQQEEEQRLHRQCAQKKIQAWERTLKQKYEAQIALNEEMETEVPRMTSEAEVEEKRQQAYHFS